MALANALTRSAVRSLPSAQYSNLAQYGVCYLDLIRFLNVTGLRYTSIRQCLLTTRKRSGISLNMKLSKLAGVFCLLSGLLQVYTASAQIDTLFMAHLTRNGLHREQLVYLNSFPPSDTLSYLKAVFFLDREGKEDRDNRGNR